MARDVVVIGASAGGLEALSVILERLPPTYRGCVLVVMHTRAESNGGLPEILARVSALPVRFAGTRSRLRPGRIYVAPPDLHLIVTDGDIELVHGPRENGFRPAIDPLFRTAARELGNRVVGVILSGALSDGVYGLSLVQHNGGATIVQDPDSATIKSMPRNAIAAVNVDYVLLPDQIAETLVRLSRDDVKGGRPMSPAKGIEPQRFSDETEVGAMEERYGAPSPLTCPDCGGTLWEIQEDRMVRYQCHVGHQYGGDSLEAEQRDAVDSALWSAVRILEEQAELKSRMARRASANGLSAVGEGFEEGARDAHRQAQTIRALLFATPPGATADDLSARAKVAPARKQTSRSRTRPRTGARAKR